MDWLWMSLYHAPSALEHAQITWNYTSWLDCIAVLVFAVMLYLHLRKSKGADHSSGQACH